MYAELFQILRAGFAGGLAVGSLVTFALYFARRQRVVLLTSVAFALVATVLVLRHISYGPASVETALLAGRLQWSIMFIFGGMIPTIIADAAEAPNCPLRPLTFLWCAICAGLVWVDGLITIPTPVSYFEVTGVQTIIPQISDHVWWFLIPPLAFSAFDQVRLASSLPSLRKHAPVFVAIGGTFTVAATNDIMVAAGVIRSFGMLDLAFGIAGFALLGLFGKSVSENFSKMEEDLREQDTTIARTEEGLRTFIANLPDMIFVVRDGEFIPSNLAAVEAFGDDSVAPTQLGTTDRDWSVLQEIADNTSTEPVALRVCVGQAEAQERVELIAVSMLVDQEPTVVVNMRRLRDREAFERKLRMNDRLSSLGTVAAGVAHEINNPVAYIAANLEFSIEELRNVVGDDELEPLREALEGSQRVAEIVAELKRFASNTPDRPGSSTSVSDAVAVALRLANAKIRHVATVDTRVPEDLPKVAIETGRLAQVVLNIVSNAADAMPHGRHSSENLVAIDAISDRGTIVIRITDNGVGMSEEVVEHLFDPFYTTKKIGDGMGLGMSISHAIVQQAGGEITVESNSAGTIFTIFLPVANCSVETTTRDVDEQPGDRKILLIDDDAYVLRATKRLLGRNHAVETAMTIGAARELVERHQFDCIICDVMMPDEDGIEFLRWLRTNEPNLARRFVFLSGGVTSAKTAREVAESGAPLLNKPLSRKVFERVIRVLSEETAQREEVEQLQTIH